MSNGKDSGQELSGGMFVLSKEIAFSKNFE